MTKPRRIKNFRKIGRRSSHQEPSSLDTSGEPSLITNDPDFSPPVVGNVASQPGRHSTHYWFVDAIDEHGTIRKEKVTVKGINDLAEVVVEFDDCFEPVGEAAGLLSGVCGQSAYDTTSFPISYDKWSDMPDAFFKKEWDSLYMIAQDSTFHERTKHIELGYHLVHDKVQDGIINLMPIPTAAQLADIHTKPLHPASFQSMLSKLNMQNIYNPA